MFEAEVELEKKSSFGPLILVIALLGGLGGGTFVHNWGYGYGAGHWGVGGIGTILLIVVILALLGYL